MSQFDEDRDAVIDRAIKEGIKIITSALGSHAIEKTLKFNTNNKCFMSFGLTPLEFDEKEIDKTINLIKKHKNTIVAIGEVGLDYYWIKDEEKRKNQKKIFRKFIELSQELNKNLVVHSRDAEKDALEILDDYKINAIMHCFSGSISDAEYAIKKGHIISIPTSVFYSKQKQNMVKNLPLEKIITETDAPYLSPFPKNRNEPVNIKYSIKKISEIKNIDEEIIKQQIDKNLVKFLPFENI